MPSVNYGIIKTLFVKILKSIIVKGDSTKYNNQIILSYINILKQITPKEAFILDKIYNMFLENGKYWYISKHEFFKFVDNISYEDFELIISDLFRLGLLKSHDIHTATTIQEDYSAPNIVMTSSYDNFEITSLGIKFIKICRN